MKNKFRKILLYVSILIFATSIFYIAYNKYTLYSEEQLNEQIREEKDSSSSSQEEKNIPEKDNEEKRILPQYEKLYEENNDMIGWISISGTVVDYPVMFTPEDPNFYLYKNWNKEESQSGSIFIDGRSNEDTENIIIYGHKMKNGTMFGSLEKFKDEEYYQQHKYIKFDSIYQERTFQIIAVSKAVIYYNEVPEGEYLFYENVELDSEEEFNQYINFMKQNSYFNIEESATYGDKLITLCTCDYWTQDARLLIVAKEIT